MHERRHEFVVEQHFGVYVFTAEYTWRPLAVTAKTKRNWPSKLATFLRFVSVCKR